MTWHKTQLGVVVNRYSLSRDKMWKARSWCADELSSEDVLWKHEFGGEWHSFYFAHLEDATAFKLIFG